MTRPATPDRTRRRERRPPDPALRLLTDAELLWATRTSGTDAFSELYHRHEHAVRSYARSLVRHAPQDAEDLTAEAFSNLLRVVRAGGGPADHPDRYLKVTVRNAVAKHHRRTQVAIAASRRLAPLVDGEQRPFSVQDPDLRAAFTSLPLRWRTVIWWTEVEGWTAVEVAGELGISPNAAAALAYRARRALRGGYVERCALSASEVA